MSTDFVQVGMVHGRWHRQRKTELASKNKERKEERYGRMDGVGIRNGLDRNGRATKEGSKCDAT